MAGAVLVAGLLVACQGSIELRTARRLAPDAPVVDPALRALAIDHSQAQCDAGQLVASPDPEATYGAGAIELVERELLDPGLPEPKDDYQATNAIWARFNTDARLDTTSWDAMAAGQTRCADGYLYMTLVLRDDGEPGFAPGVVRITAGNDATSLGGISTDGTTVAIRSEASDLVPGTTAADIYTYDVAADALSATGVEPDFSTFRGVALAPDGATIFYDAEVFDPEIGVAYIVGALDVGAGTTSVRTGPNFHTVESFSTSADAGVMAYQELGAGGRSLFLSVAGEGTESLGGLDGFSFAVSVSDDGRYVSRAGGNVDVYDRTTSSYTTVRENCVSDNLPTTGDTLSADGRFLAYNCLDLDADADSAQDLFVWDRTTDTSKRLTSDEDGRAAIGAPSISDDGRFVAFSYDRPSAPSGAGTYLWDRTTDRSTLIAPVASNVTVSGNGGTVAFTAVAPDQADPSITDLYVWDNPAA